MISYRYLRFREKERTRDKKMPLFVCGQLYWATAMPHLVTVVTLMMLTHGPQARLPRIL